MQSIYSSSFKSACPTFNSSPRYPFFGRIIQCHSFVNALLSFLDLRLVLLLCIIPRRALDRTTRQPNHPAISPYHTIMGTLEIVLVVVAAIISTIGIASLINIATSKDHPSMPV